LVDELVSDEMASRDDENESMLPANENKTLAEAAGGNANGHGDEDEAESTRIAQICVECERIEIEWRRHLRCFKLVEVVCYSLGLMFTVVSLTLSLLLVLPNKSWLHSGWSLPARHFLTLIYESSKSAIETNHLLVPLPIAFVLVDAVSLLLDAIQCATIWLTWRVIGMVKFYGTWESTSGCLLILNLTLRGRVMSQR
jgi:hypothetical protein